MDWNSPNASGVGPQSCYNCRGFQNLSLLSVSEKNQRKVNKIEQFSWFWAIFVIKQCNRVEACSPNSSTVGLHGCFNWRGYHNFSLLSVRKKISGKLIKLHVFLDFEHFLLSNSEAGAGWREIVPTPQVEINKAKLLLLTRLSEFELAER